MPHKKRMKQILDAGVRLYREKGFDETSVQDICDACGITKPTFYKYVSSKEEVLRHFYDGTMEDLLTRLQELEDEGNYWGMIWSGFTNTSNYSVNLGWELLSKYLIMNFHEHTVTARYNAAGRERTTEAIRLAQQAGQIRNMSDPDTLFMVLKNIGLSMMLKWVMTRESFDYYSTYYKTLESALLPDYDVIHQACGK